MKTILKETFKKVKKRYINIIACESSNRAIQTDTLNSSPLIALSLILYTYIIRVCEDNNNRIHGLKKNKQ